MILLDTNVISELMRNRPEPKVVRWFETVAGECAISTPALAEIAFGVEKLPQGKRRLALDEQLSEWRMFFADRTLAFTGLSATIYGGVMADALKQGHNMGVIDGLIAAIAIEQEATLATRNTKDFKSASIELINPWEAS
ncbi:MAG: type II toxin-antitoxin system VapC family toxin [Sphingomonadales bacterium]|nr:type II toxin-antitoxin system VapC family toxin [Sphingomonadales bacterium]MBK9003217.1 type II toxin-antitoxin system VapC family toxin [Sphingomonadales bacterium]MBK9268464.1 type II toxin-antitoxin system VapC family toxin [Sphingomonadales bacterium]MBP6433710.1 type II toxin-antitoxin system VapC family toxin [Sphingorhabdus sp.]